jgi:hypothetical protein
MCACVLQRHPPPHVYEHFISLLNRRALSAHNIASCAASDDPALRRNALSLAFRWLGALEWGETALGSDGASDRPGGDDVQVRGPELTALLVTPLWPHSF